MLGTLGNDLIGTNPVYPKIVNHDWLAVDSEEYDNYPSDNNSVRVIPDLAEMWNPKAETGANLVPNLTVQSLGCKTAEQTEAAYLDSVNSIVREAKKAAMAGLTGKALTSHLRSRFALKHIVAAADSLKKVADETGLLGNVYIDGSAFDSYDEACQFLNNNRARLARDILVDSRVNQSVMSMLASRFRKNIVASVQYTADMFAGYKSHLVASGKIPTDFVIDSKESLREAFLYTKEKAPAVKVASAEESSMDQSVISNNLKQLGSEHAYTGHEAAEALNFRKIKNVVAFAQDTLSLGKTASDLKDMLRKKYAMVDIKDASNYLAIVISSRGLSEEHLDELVSEGKISSDISSELKKIARKHPVKMSMFGTPEKTAKAVGVQGYLYNLDGHTVTDKFESFRKASVEALLKGIDPEQVQDKLLTKMSAEEAAKVISDAVSLMNSVSAGTVANKSKKAKKAFQFDEPSRMPALPDASTIAQKSQEIADVFAGADTDIAIEGKSKHQSLEIDSLYNMHGIDSVV